MKANQVNIFQIFRNISFEANTTSAVQQPISSLTKDSFEVANKVEPPVISTFDLTISTLDLTFNRITDKQIAQINQAKILPQNARFEKLYAYGGKNAMLREPIYQIVPHIPIVPKINEHTRKLPEGYQVVKITQGRLKGFIGAIPIQKK